jgi:outer membrane protein assembly factor BamB
MFAMIFAGATCGARASLNPIRRAAALAAVATLGLAACSSRDPALTKPADLTDLTGAVTVKEVWRAEIGKARGAALLPAVFENAVYAASGEGTVARIDPATGRVMWEAALDVPVSAGVGSDGLRVVVATARGDVITLGPDGKELWRARVPSDVTAPPLVGHGLVIVRSTDHRLTAFEADSGKRRWVFQRQQPPLTLRAPTEMAFAGDNVLIGYPGGRMVALALANGAARWDSAVAEPRGTTEVERLADVVGPVAVDDRDVCAAAFQGRLMCGDASTGNLRWSRDLSAGSGPAIGERQVVVVDARSQVVAFERSTGAALWRNESLRNRQLTSPLITPRGVAVGDLEGYVHFLAASDGAFFARTRVDNSPIVARPQRWNDAVVVQSQDGVLALLALGR